MHREFSINYPICCLYQINHVLSRRDFQKDQGYLANIVKLPVKNNLLTMVNSTSQVALSLNRAQKNAIYCFYDITSYRRALKPDKASAWKLNWPIRRCVLCKCSLCYIHEESLDMKFKDRQWNLYINPKSKLTIPRSIKPCGYYQFLATRII